jgi:pimeloyl-ACP methyl ester carboxylesterase
MFLILMSLITCHQTITLAQNNSGQIPQEVRSIAGTFIGSWTSFGVDDKGQIVKRAAWNDIVRAENPVVKEDRAYVTTTDEMVFEGARIAPMKVQGTEGYFLNKDGSLGDYYFENFGQVYRTQKLGKDTWVYAMPANPRELSQLGFANIISAGHVIVKVVTYPEGVETHRISRITTVNWKDAEGKDRWLQYVSLQGVHQRYKSDTVLPVPVGNPVSTVDRGKLLVFSGDKQIGTEGFRISADNSGESSDELNAGGQTLKFASQIILDPKTLRAHRIILEQGAGLRLVFDVNGSEVKVTGSKEAAGQTDADAVILENNLWYQYFFLVKRYDGQKGGAQQFKAFAPSLMQSFPITIELKGSIGSVPDATSKLIWYEVSAPGELRFEVVTDASGKLVYVAVPSQRADAVREEYAGSITQLRAAVSPKTTAARTDNTTYDAPPGATFTSEEVKIPVRGYLLTGTLLLPKDCGGPCAAVVMITGSGQQTRDEPVPFRGLEQYKPFRQIAEVLASHRIAVLRVDDRGVGESTGLETLKASTTSGFADDTRAQVAYLRTRKEIDPVRIALVGHSEGGMIAPMVAASDPRIAAVVLLAGPGERGSEISLYQARRALDALPGMTKEEKEQKLAEERDYIKAVQEGRDLSKYPAEARLPWVIEWMKSDPIPTIRKVRQPILILQGALDQQVSADQARLLEQAARAAGNKDVTAHIFQGLNHLFLQAHTGAVGEYSSLRATAIPGEVLLTLSEWLQSRLYAR